MGQIGRTLNDSLPFIPVDFFRGSSGFSESRAERGGKTHEAILPSEA